MKNTTLEEMIYKTKHDYIKIYAKIVEQEAISQILEVANSPLGENAHIRIMPDCHAGAGCVIGATMMITDKVCPNLVGVDIGCGVDLIKTDIDFLNRLEELDSVIRRLIPFGANTHIKEKQWDFENLICWQHLSNQTKEKAKTALGTLGGGNHFIEAYKDGWIAVHSGSRNIGYKVAEYYQKLAEKRIKEYNRNLLKEKLKNIEPKMREAWLRDNRISINKDLCYLTNEDMKAYLHDVAIMQRFANDNRMKILQEITSAMRGKIVKHIGSIHNYIDTENMILRKGAISAQKGQLLVVPLNMRDGLLICYVEFENGYGYKSIIIDFDEDGNIIKIGS